MAAAFDERIGAVVPSSGNSGELDPWRYTTEPFGNESIELLAGVQSHWFNGRLRFSLAVKTSCRSIDTR